MAAHTRTRRRGVSAWLHWTVRIALTPWVRIVYRVRLNGADRIPANGPVIIAANHRSNLDPIMIGLLVGRPMHFAAKEEMFANRLAGRLLSAIGAFPVRRGRADRQMLETAHAVLERGDCLLIFPEGTRSRGRELRRPKRGLGEIALDSGAAVVPVAVVGTDAPRHSPLERRRISVSAADPQRFERPTDPPPRLSQAVLDEVWAEVTELWTTNQPPP